MSALRISNLNMTFPDGSRGLRDISFEVERGERVVLLGANGAGKSTLLQCVTRLRSPTSGTITVGSVETTTADRRQLREARLGVGMVFQHFHLMESLTVFHNTLHGGLGRSRSPRAWFPLTATQADRVRAMDCLERVGLASMARRRAGTLSGGEKQRVAIARTLMQQPQLILADEPVASLDPRTGRHVMDLLWDIGREQGITIVCTLHQLELAREYADRLIGLRFGQLVFDRPNAGVEDTDLDGLYAASAAGAPAAGTLGVPR